MASAHRADALPEGGNLCPWLLPYNGRLAGLETCLDGPGHTVQVSD